MGYVTKNEIRKWRKVFDTWIDLIRNDIKTDGITFVYRLVGSAKRNLVIRHHNKGYDLDFQIILKNWPSKYKCKELKELFMQKLNSVVTNDGFSHCEDSTSSITIKKADANDSKIDVSYDVVIIREVKKRKEMTTEILRHHKKTGQESWVFESLPDIGDIEKKFNKIKELHLFGELRKLYLKKKHGGNCKQKSFQLFREAMNETLKNYKTGQNREDKHDKSERTR